MFDLDCLKIGYLERFFSEHFCFSLGVGEGKVKYSSDLLCMERVVCWWPEALEKVLSNWRNQTAGGTANQNL